MKRIATIDVGTNTVLLLISELQAGRLVAVYEAQRFGRLGQGVDASRQILPAAMARVRTALLAYKTVCEAYQVGEIYVGGTSATRDAANQAALIAYLEAETGLRLHVVSGEQEALWSFKGALAMQPNVQGSCAVLDIGGGSTEVILGTGVGQKVQYHQSFKVGSIRIRERFFDHVPPRVAAREAAAAFIQGQFSQIPQQERPQQLVVVSGVGTVLGLLEAKATSFMQVPDRHSRLTAMQVKAWHDRVLGCSPQEVFAINPAVLEGRGDIFGASLMILWEFMQVFGFETCLVSAGGWRHGWALELFNQNQS